MPNWWSATYEHKGKLVTINDLSTAECPVSLTTHEMLEWLSTWVTASRFEHGLLYGPDLSQWPARALEVFEIFSAEENKVLQLRTENG